MNSGKNVKSGRLCRAGLLTVGFECIVESDGALRRISIERQSQENLRRNPSVLKPWHIFKAYSSDTATSDIAGQSQVTASPSQG
jgi:hypothetical protein